MTHFADEKICAVKLQSLLIERTANSATARIHLEQSPSEFMEVVRMFPISLGLKESVSGRRRAHTKSCFSVPLSLILKSHYTCILSIQVAKVPSGCYNQPNKYIASRGDTHL